MRGADRRQRAENGYYLPCSRCRRLAHEIGRDGCADPGCSDPAERGRGRRRASPPRGRAAAHRVGARRARAGRRDGTRPSIAPLIGPDDAVARFLGATAVTELTRLSRPTARRAAAHGPPLPPAPIAGLVKAAFAAAAARTGRFAGAYCATPVRQPARHFDARPGALALDQLAAGSGQELTAGADAGRSSAPHTRRLRSRSTRSPPGSGARVSSPSRAAPASRSSGSRRSSRPDYRAARPTSMSSRTRERDRRHRVQVHGVPRQTRGVVPTELRAGRHRPRRRVMAGPVSRRSSANRRSSAVDVGQLFATTSG